MKPLPEMPLGDMAEKPFVSIIMPVFNEAGFIERSLTAIFGQRYPHERMEVIVADGKSTDATGSLLAELAKTSPIAITILENRKQIAPAGLNLAIAAAKGEIVIRVDGHCEVASDYVENCVRKLRSGAAECVGGPIETVGETPEANAIAAAMGSAFGVGGSAFRTVNDQEMYVDTVAFPAYSRLTLARTGEFNEELIRNQDDEYNYRIRKMSGRILLSPDIRSRYFSRSSFKSLWRQYFQYGFWKVRVFQLHPLQMSIRQFVPSVFVLSILLFSAIGMFNTSAAYIVLVLISSYLLAALLFSVLAVGCASLNLVPRVLLSFCILHISYGLGFLVGMFAFIHRWSSKSNARHIPRGAGEN